LLNSGLFVFAFVVKTKKAAGRPSKRFLVMCMPSGSAQLMLLEKPQKSHGNSETQLIPLPCLHFTHIQHVLQV